MYNRVKQFIGGNEMKKMLILCIIIFMMPGMAVFATFDPYFPEEMITVNLYDNEHEYFRYDDEITGYLDMLVRKNKVGQRLLPEISDLFTNLHQDVVNTDFLDRDSEWISYTAYVENAYVFRGDSQPRAQYRFAYREDIIYFNSFKFVYFDELGNLKCETDEIMITSPDEEEWIEVDIRLNMDTGDYDLDVIYDTYTTGDWGNVIRLLFRIFFTIIGIILGSALLLISAFKLYEVYQKRRDLR